MAYEGSRRLQRIQEGLLQGKLVTARLKEIEDQKAAISGQIADRLRKAGEDPLKVMEEGAGRIKPLNEQMEEVNQGRGLVGQAFQLLGEGLRRMGLTGQQVDQGIDDLLGSGPKTGEQVVIDPASLRVYIGRETDAEMTPRGLQLIGALPPGETVDIADLKRRVWGKVETPAATVATAKDTADGRLASVLNGQPAIERPAMGRYRRHPLIRIAGEGQEGVSFAPTVEEASPIPTPGIGSPRAEGSFMTGEVAKLSGVPDHVLVRLMRLGVLEQGVHFVKEPGERYARFTENGVTAARAIGRGLEGKGKRVRVEDVKKILTTVYIREALSGGDVASSPETDDPMTLLELPADQFTLSAVDVSAAAGVARSTIANLAGENVLVPRFHQFKPRKGGYTVFSQKAVEDLSLLKSKARGTNRSRLTPEWSKPIIDELMAARLAAAQAERSGVDQGARTTNTNPGLRETVVVPSVFGVGATTPAEKAVPGAGEELRSKYNLSAQNMMQLEQLGILKPGLHVEIIGGNRRFYRPNTAAQAIDAWLASGGNFSSTIPSEGEGQKKKTSEAGLNGSAPILPADEIIVTNLLIMCTRPLCARGIIDGDPESIVGDLKRRMVGLSNSNEFKPGELKSLRTVTATKVMRLLDESVEAANAQLEEFPTLKMVVNMARGWKEKGQTGLLRELVRALENPPEVRVAEVTLDRISKRTVLIGPLGDQDFNGV